MANLIEIKIDDKSVNDALDRLLARAEDMTPVMAEISEILLDATWENFDQQGRPAWEPLKPSTIAERTRDGHWPGKILQRSGQLRAAVHPFHDAANAGVSVAAPYAAIHQLGGQAGRNHAATIPARPYLPVTADGELQPEARTAVLDAFNAYLLDPDAG